MPQPDLPITIRGYERRDNDRIRELTLEGFDGVSIDQNADALLGLDTEPLWETRKWAGVKAELEASPSNHFVAVLEGEVIGYITTNPQPSAGIGQIPNMAVDARYRRRGVASRLIEHALEHLRSCGMRVAKIETLVQNAQGQTLYPRFGFREVARQIHYVRRLDDA